MGSVDNNETSVAVLPRFTPKTNVLLTSLDVATDATDTESHTGRACAPIIA